MTDINLYSNEKENGVSEESTFKILIATDIHLGFDETNPVTGDDSFNTFEEILMLANSRDVDFILLAGDLFHKAQPSTMTLNRCIQLLRTYTLGSKDIEFQIIEPEIDESEKEASCSTAITGQVNYEDDNMNVSFPVFTIHGNHDDVVNHLSAMDILNSSGLVNYFGKYDSLLEVQLEPIILQKGETNIALYGLSHIPDRRLHNLFTANKVDVKFAGNLDDVNENFFNIMAIHQNRADRGAKNFISVDMLPKFMNMIIWGHEHDCRIEPEQYNLRTYVVQPGSSVATSLCEGEAIEKKVGVLQVCYNEYRPVNDRFLFKLTPIQLKTVRPFIFKTIELRDHYDEIKEFKGEKNEPIEKFLDKIVKEMLNNSKKLLTDHPQQPKLPLIRLRIIVDNSEHIINVKRYGYKFNQIVANHEDMILFKKNIKKLKFEKGNVDEAALESANQKRERSEKVEDVVERYFGEFTEEKNKLKLFDFKCLSEVVRCFVEKEDDEGAKMIIQSQSDEAERYVNENREEGVKELLQRFRDEKSMEVFEESIIRKSKRMKDPIIGGSRSTKGSDAISHEAEDVEAVNEVIDSDDDFDMTTTSTRSTRGSSTRGSRAGSSSARGAKGVKRAAPVKDTVVAKKTTSRGRGKAVQSKVSIANQLAASRSMRSTQQSSVPSHSVMISSDED